MKFNLFDPSTWLPSLEATVQRMLEEAKGVSLASPFIWLWKAFWFCVGKVLKACLLALGAFAAIFAYAFSNGFGCWSLLVAFIAIFIAGPIAFTIWVIIWILVLLCRAISWLTREIFRIPQPTEIETAAIHKKQWTAWNLFLLGMILLSFPCTAAFGVVVIIFAFVYVLAEQVEFWILPARRKAKIAHDP